MAKAKRKVKSVYPNEVTTAGLQHRYNHNQLEVITDKDEENPKRTVHRLKVRSAYDELFTRGTITKEQRDCAEQYAILCEKAAGATQDLYAKINLLSESRSKWEPSQSQHEAYEKLFKIWALLGKSQKIILNAIVINNMNASRFSLLWQRNRDFHMGRIVLSFERLEEIMQTI